MSKLKITLTRMNPKARRLLDRVCKEYEELFKKDIRETNGYQALYWTLRYSEAMKRMLNNRKLQIALKELWDNDDHVPDEYNQRCSKLNWFSSGIKNNIVYHISKRIFGEDFTNKLLEI